MYHYVCNHCVKWDPEWLDFALFSGVNIEAMSLFFKCRDITVHFDKCLNK